MGTNNAVIDSSEDICSKLISLVDTINCSLPKCNVVISSLIKRTDNRKTNGVCEKVNTLLKASNYRVLENSTWENVVFILMHKVMKFWPVIYSMQSEIKNEVRLIVI